MAAFGGGNLSGVTVDATGTQEIADEITVNGAAGQAGQDVMTDTTGNFIIMPGAGAIILPVRSAIMAYLTKSFRFITSTMVNVAPALTADYVWLEEFDVTIIVKVGATIGHNRRTYRLAVNNPEGLTVRSAGHLPLDLNYPSAYRNNLKSS